MKEEIWLYVNKDKWNNFNDLCLIPIRFQFFNKLQSYEFQHIVTIIIVTNEYFHYDGTKKVALNVW